jgi:hypothetical protein
VVRKEGSEVRSQPTPPSDWGGKGKLGGRSAVLGVQSFEVFLPPKLSQRSAGSLKRIGSGSARLPVDPVYKMHWYFIIACFRTTVNFQVNSMVPSNQFSRQLANWQPNTTLYTIQNVSQKVMLTRHSLRRRNPAVLHLFAESNFRNEHKKYGHHKNGQ